MTEEIQTPYLKLKSGEILKHSEAGYAEGSLWCWVNAAEATMTDVFRLFSDPEKTSVIELHYGDIVTTFTGFIELQVIRKMEKTIDVKLTGSNTDMTTERIEKDEREAG